jgi:hypothetical protein
MNVIFYAADGMDDTTEGVSFADDITIKFWLFVRSD